MADFLVNKAGIWHVRLDIPSEVREAFGGRRVLTKSLKTGVKTEAHALKLKWLDLWKRQINDARTKPIDDFREEAAYRVEQIDRHAPNAVYESAKVLTDIYQQYKIKSPELGEELRQIVAFESEYSPKTPFIKKRLEDFEKYEKETRGVAHRTVDSHIKRLKSFDKFLKDNEKELNFDTVSEFLQTLDLSAKTKKQYIFSLNTFWNFATKKDRGFREKYKNLKNPFKDHEFTELRRGTASDKNRRAFTKPEIERLYSEAKKADRQRLAEAIKIASYTGARIEEICQLRVVDVIKEDGIDCLHIREGKTTAAVRHVPIHPKIVKDIKRLVNSSEDGYLLKTAAGGKYETKSKGISSEFSIFKKALGFDRRCVFHSFRKSVITMLERADAKNLVIMSIVGHEPGKFLNMTFDRYSEGPTPAAKLIALKNLDFDFTV
ncbi:tyrosine-type recombinase/integrase [Stutzerimonas zhaodongensis]|jgi:integrase|uniref:tyrosine-type recombinase/integrase n=1 Tax=Stutzerimonas zhaodongensis TaxID=1176257 RepID=UPI001F4E7D57|nr:tyrosine-type recombinase/integrase [Stutzerimonas zhaodongensis]UNG17541.1 tyrosine-type recombinase/integrase [Stutzerimonas zhaodongensis]